MAINRFEVTGSIFKFSFWSCQMTVNWETADVTDRQRAILEMAMAVTKNEPITDEHFTNLERHGLDQRDAFDIGHYAAFFALANRLAIFTKLRPNDEFSGE